MGQTLDKSQSDSLFSKKELVMAVRNNHATSLSTSYAGQTSVPYQNSSGVVSGLKFVNTHARHSDNIVPPMAWNPSGTRVSLEKGFTTMSNSGRGSSTTNDPTRPVWCQHCSVRIAPYDRRTFKKGKPYHEGCYSKITSRNTKGGRN